MPLPPPPPASPAARQDRNEALAAALSRAALGDRAAFGTVYRLASGHLFGVILRIQSDRTLAEDILQDTFVNVWRAAGSFDSARAQPLTWLTSIARNRAIDSLRRAQTDPRTVSHLSPDASGDDETDLLDSLATDGPGPLELLQQASEARSLDRCIERLSSEQQQALALAFYQGQSHAEVAEHLSQPLGTVKSWLRRGLLALKDCLAGLHGQGRLEG